MSEKPASPAFGGATSTARPPLEPLRHRPLARASTMAEPPTAGSAAPLRRRSSFMTADSFDRASFRSSTDSLLLPRPARTGAGARHAHVETEESSHAHSLPLALALLPAVGGLLFSNGSAVLTDATLLVLAAIFLNWSVRLPWDWYHSAQSVRLQEEAEQEAAEEEGYFPSSASPTSTIEEEPAGLDGDDEGSPVMSPPQAPQTKRSPRATQPPAAAAASRELRMHEVAALCACFVLPVAGAWLLHRIRAQLSRPSEGLVSDYNLSIFLLAAELRPLSHLLRMVQARTLHLQRVVAANPHAAAQGSPVQDLSTRVDELEAHVAAAGAGAPRGGQAGDDAGKAEERQQVAAQVEAALRRALQPDIDAVTRATRRYEKRAALLAAQTDARLTALEARIADAVSLAAGAERASQARAAAPLAKLAHAAGAGASAMGEATMWALTLPLRAAEGAAAAAASCVRWVVLGTVGRVVDPKRLGLSQPAAAAARKGKKRTVDKPGWKGREQSVDGGGFGRVKKARDKGA